MKKLIKNEIEKVNGGKEVVRYKIYLKGGGHDVVEESMHDFLIFHQDMSLKQQEEVAKAFREIMKDISSKTLYKIMKEVEVVPG